MVVFDLYSGKKTIKLSLPNRCSAGPTAALFFQPARAVIKAAEAGSIRPSSSAVKPFIKTSNSPSWRMHAH